MTIAKKKPTLRVLSSTLVLSLVGASLNGLTVYADTGFTPPQAVMDHLAQNDWASLQGILTNIYGNITTPLKISDLDKGQYTTGQLLGNGDIGAIAAGVSTTSQQFYFGKNDFWGTLHAQGNAVKDNSGILSAGGLDINPTTAAGSQASSVFNMKQDILQAQVTTNIQLKDNTNQDANIQLNSWTADTDNVFVTEVTNNGSGAVTLNTKQWVPSMAYANSSATDLTDAQSTYPYTGGIDTSGLNPVLWTTRDSCAGTTGNTSGERSRLAEATTVVGTTLSNTKEKVESNDYYDSNKGKYYNSLGEAGDFTVNPGSTVYVVTYFASSSGNYAQIESVNQVQADAVKGVSAYTSVDAVNQLKSDHLSWWKNYWLKSYAQFNDPDLNQYYYGSHYILGSSNRPTSSNGKVNPHNLPGSLYGPWIPADNVGWGGRYFLNYNQQAQYYASGSTNRIDTEIPYGNVIAYDEPWQINNAAAQGFDGIVHNRTLSPFDVLANPQPALNPVASTKKYGFNTGSTDQKSNGTFAAVPMIFYYEYTLDDTYLKNTLYPYLKQLLTFYSEYVLKQDDGNGQYHYSVIGSSIHEGDAADINPDLDIGAIKMLSRFLVDHAAEMNESQTNIDRWKDLAAHTSFPQEMLPQGIFSANNNSNLVPTITATGYQSPNQAHVDMIEPGDQPVELEGVVFPFENVQMLDGDKEMLQKVINTLTYMNSWSAGGFAGWSSQNNGFCKVYPIAARAGWNAADLLTKLKTALASKVRTSNLTYYQSGGAVETIGAMEGLDSMLMQSSTSTSMPSTIWAFPNWDMTKSVSYERLGAMGNVTVSSAYDATTQTVPYVDITSKRDGKIALVNPWTQGKPVVEVVNSDNTLGSTVSYTITGGKIVFDGKADTRYMVMNDTSDSTQHVSGIDFNKYSTTLIYNGTNGTDSTTVNATVKGNPNDTITWTSSDPSVVAVSGNGSTAKLKADGIGTNKVSNVTVTATSTQDPGLSQSIKVQVADSSTLPTGLQMLSPASATIYGPQSTDPSVDKVTGTDRLQLTAQVTPSNAYNKQLLWTTSNPNVAMVDQNGLVIARGQGTVTITGVSLANPSIPPVTCTVTVTASGPDDSTDATLATVLANASTISSYAGNTTSAGGFTQVSTSPNWESMQEIFQQAYINALGVKAKYSSYSTFNISKDTAYFAAIALNEAIRAIDPSKAIVISNVDRTALQQAINKAMQYTSANFDTSSDWTNLQNALSNAQTVINNQNATQDDVNNALAILQAAMSKVSKQPVQTISLAHVGLGTSSYNKNNSGYIAYSLGAVGLDLNTSTKLLPTITDQTALVATANPATATDKSIIWSVKDLVGTNVVLLGSAQTDSNANLTMLTSTSTAQGTTKQQFDSVVPVTAQNPGVAMVTATNPASGVSANYIVTVSSQVMSYKEAEISNDTDSSYIGSTKGSDKTTTGSTASGGALAGNINNTKGLQISNINGGANGGNYNLVVYYSTTTARNSTQRAIAVTLNGTTYKFVTNGMSYNYDFPETVPVDVTVPLAPGMNTIQLFGDGSLTGNTNAPNIDKVGYAQADDFTAIDSNVTAVSSNSVSVLATVASTSTNDLNHVRNNVTYQILKDGNPVGNPVSVNETALKPTSGLTYEYDAANANIIPAGIGTVLRNYAVTLNQSDYTAAGSYSVQFSTTDGTTTYTSNPVSLFTVADTTPPVTTSVVTPGSPDGQNGWYTHPVTVTFSATDDSSGVAKTEYSVDNGATWQTYTAPVLFATSGQYTVLYRSADSAGNVESPHSVSFQVDTQGPTIAISTPTSGSLADSGVLTPQFSVSDDQSGVDATKTVVTLDGQTIAQGTTLPLYTLPLGSHTYSVTAVDNAGNTSTQSVTFQTSTNIDSLKALVTLFGNNGSIDNQGIVNSLQTKLKLGAVGLQSFVNEVNAQSGKHITTESATYMVRDAKFIQHALSTN